MTTMIVDVQNSVDAHKVADALRLMKCVKKISIQENGTFERIPGLPYTTEERIASVRESMEDYYAGRMVSSEELRTKIEKW
jgi:hypothetical protein